MGFDAIVTTVFGGMLFPFLIALAWGRAAEEAGPFGGIAIAGFIVGTSWMANHGVGLIVQTGPWVDMAYAAFVGLFVGAIYSGDSASKAMPTVISGIIGGIIGGFVLAAL